jgi:hypothetical protein
MFTISDSTKLVMGRPNIWSPINRHPITITIKVRVILLDGGERTVNGLSG